MWMWGCWITLSLAARGGSDVVADVLIDAQATEVSDYLSRLDQVSEIFPEDCAQDWIVGPELQAPHAMGEVVVRAALLKRRLAVTYGEVIPGRIVDLDHTGDKGFVTRFEIISDVDLPKNIGGTGITVVMTTFLSPPNWPLKRYFERKIHPAWLDCHRRTLENLAQRLSR